MTDLDNVTLNVNAKLGDHKEMGIVILFRDLSEKNKQKALDQSDLETQAYFEGASEAYQDAAMHILNELDLEVQSCDLAGDDDG